MPLLFLTASARPAFYRLSAGAVPALSAMVFFCKSWIPPIKKPFANLYLGGLTHPTQSHFVRLSGGPGVRATFVPLLRCRFIEPSSPFNPGAFLEKRKSLRYPASPPGRNHPLPGTITVRRPFGFFQTISLSLFRSPLGRFLFLAASGQTCLCSFFYKKDLFPCTTWAG